MEHFRMHQKLIVWKEAYILCLELYKATNGFPKHEQFALVQQIRRAAVSVAANIAEGNVKTSLKDMARFLEISSASLEEVHCEVLLAKDLGYIDEKRFSTINDRLNRVSYLLMKFKSSVSSVS